MWGWPGVEKTVTGWGGLWPPSFRIWDCGEHRAAALGNIQQGEAAPAEYLRTDTGAVGYQRRKAAAWGYRKATEDSGVVGGAFWVGGMA